MTLCILSTLVMVYWVETLPLEERNMIKDQAQRIDFNLTAGEIWSYALGIQVSDNVGTLYSLELFILFIVLALKVGS